jgi:hypothetical protein
LGSLAAGQPAPAGAQPVGSEFQVNTHTASFQRTGPDTGGQRISTDASGNFVVVWQSRGQDGSGWGVFGQRYDSTGTPVGSEFRANTRTLHHQEYPSVAVAGDGEFVVVWNTTLPSGAYVGIFGQRFDSDGAPQGDEFRIDSLDSASQSHPSLASDAAGNFVVVWVDFVGGGGNFEISGQRYDSDGVALGGQFRVNTDTAAFQFLPSVASDASGDFVVVWESSGQDGNALEIFGQRFDSQGSPQGSEFRVNTTTTNDQRSPSVAASAGGDFVVVWEGCCPKGGFSGIFGQRYDSAGAPLGGEFQVNTHTGTAHRYPSVSSDADGSFVVAWASVGQDGRSYGVFGQRYDRQGRARGSEFQINSFTTSIQWHPSVGATGRHRFVVVWESANQDGSGFGVFGRRINPVQR